MTGVWVECFSSLSKSLWGRRKEKRVTCESPFSVKKPQESQSYKCPREMAFNYWCGVKWYESRWNSSSHKAEMIPSVTLNAVNAEIWQETWYATQVWPRDALRKKTWSPWSLDINGNCFSSCNIQFSRRIVEYSYTLVKMCKRVATHRLFDREQFHTRTLLHRRFEFAILALNLHQCIHRKEMHR